jgi:hypothetical protein
METKQQTKTENPLFPIARQKHYNDYASCDFKFLNDHDDNEDTYTLGFCRGVSHSTEIWQKQIGLLQQRVKELESLQAPTLTRQDSQQ